MVQQEKQKADIIDYLKNRKQNGHTTVSDIDVMERFRMPIEEVDRIFSELQRDGLIARHQHQLSD